jgi:hypothetical protein
MNNKLVTVVLCYEIHIGSPAPRIRVKIIKYVVTAQGHKHGQREYSSANKRIFHPASFPASTSFSDESALLTLTPPSESVYGSQFFDAKLLQALN